MYIVFVFQCGLLIGNIQEEHPPIIPNFGMGSVLVNYYRKKDEKDDHVPKVGFSQNNCNNFDYNSV